MVAGDGSGGKKWRELSRRELLDARIFKVTERENEAPNGRRGRFVVLEAPDWASVVPVVHREGKLHFLMVRQFRHGSGEPSLEFPGGVVEPGESPEAAAARELREETGWKAGRLRSAGWVSPNPAIMNNRFHVYVADRLEAGIERELDEHEIVDALLVPAEQFHRSAGGDGCTHALMVAALFLAERLLAEDPPAP